MTLMGRPRKRPGSNQQRSERPDSRNLPHLPIRHAHETRMAMTHIHKATRLTQPALTIQRVRAVLEQESQAWTLLRGLQWGYGRVPLCPRCSRPCWADDRRDARKRWECQGCPRNPRNRNTTKFSDAVNTPFDRTRVSLALALLLFACGPPALAIIKKAKVPAAKIPTRTMLSADAWKDKSLFRSLMQRARQLRSQQFDLSQMVRRMADQATQNDEKRVREIKKQYNQKIDALEKEITALRQNMQQELRALRRYKPIGLAS